MKIDNIDIEDTFQFILSQKVNCFFIISNNSKHFNFVNKKVLHPNQARRVLLYWLIFNTSPMKKGAKHLKNIKIYQRAAEITAIINDAIANEQEENRKKGVPNVYSMNDVFIYEMPNGEIVIKKQGD